MTKSNLNSELRDPRPNQGLGCRTVNNVKYYGGHWYEFKSEADNMLRRLRKNGMRAIIVPAVYRKKKGFRIYDAGWET